MLEYDLNISAFTWQPLNHFSLLKDIGLLSITFVFKLISKVHLFHFELLVCFRLYRIFFQNSSKVHLIG